MYLVFIFELNRFFWPNRFVFVFGFIFEPNLFVFVFLTKYIRIHIRGSKYYSLTSFRQAGTLKTHMLSHSGMKPHKCGQCEKSFRVAANLKTHILTHTGVKKHSCQKCDRSFSQALNLKDHMLSHSGEKAHNCNQCGHETVQPCNHNNLNWIHSYTIFIFQRNRFVFVLYIGFSIWFYLWTENIQIRICFLFIFEPNRFVFLFVFFFLNRIYSYLYFFYLTKYIQICILF